MKHQLCTFSPETEEITSELTIEINLSFATKMTMICGFGREWDMLQKGIQNDGWSEKRRLSTQQFSLSRSSPENGSFVNVWFQLLIVKEKGGQGGGQMERRKYSENRAFELCRDLNFGTSVPRRMKCPIHRVCYSCQFRESRTKKLVLFREPEMCIVKSIRSIRHSG
jgi:hypothetical protein